VPADARRRRIQLAALLANTVATQAVAFVLRPNATYRAIELDVAGPWLGLLAASINVAPLVLAIPAGHATDRFGERRIMIGGAILLSGSGLLFLAAGHTIAGIVAATAVLGAGHLCSVVSQQALVANASPADRYDTAFGRYTFAASIGQALGPGLIIAFGGSQPIPHTEAIFVGAALLTAVPLASALLLRPSGQRAPIAAAGGTGMRELLRRPGLLRALTVSSIVLAAVDITLVYLPALGAEHGIAAGAVGILLTLRAVSSMASRLFLGRLAAALGRRVLLICSIAIAAAGLALMAIPMPVWALAVVVAAAGFGLGAGPPLTMAWLAEATPPGLQGRAMSLRLTGNRLGQLILPSAAGLVAAGAGAGGVLAATAAGLTVAAAAARRLDRSSPMQGEGS
jgi:MFS family permease